MNFRNKMQELQALKALIAQWNANRMDLFALSQPNEDLEFHGVMRFYFQDYGQKMSTKCIRVSSIATAQAVIDTLIEKFRPDMRMLSNCEYALYEVNSNKEERKLAPDEKPLLAQLKWHKDDLEGRFLLRRIEKDKSNLKLSSTSLEDSNFKRKLSRREKKQLKKQDKLRKLHEGENDLSVVDKLYNEIPETSFTRSLSNPEGVMKRRRQQKLERKLQQFRSRDGGPDTGGTLKIYGESLCKNVPYKTLLLSVHDTALTVIKEMLQKYGLQKEDPANYCLIVCAGLDVASHGSSGGHSNMKEYILDDDECPLAILMKYSTSQTNETIMFHIRKRPPDYQHRKRKKKPISFGNELDDNANESLPYLVEVDPDGHINNKCPKMFRLHQNVTEVGNEKLSQGSGHLLQLSGSDISPHHCVLALMDNIVTVTPSCKEAEIFVDGTRIYETTLLQHGSLVRFGKTQMFQLIDPIASERTRRISEPMNKHEEQLKKSNLETTFDVDGKIETVPTGIHRNVHSIKPEKPASVVPGSQILPAVLEFKEETEDIFLDAIITSLDINALLFKLAPTYTLYMAARFRASTHFKPEITPQERAMRLTSMLNIVSLLMQAVIKKYRSNINALAFWMANCSEFLHFLKQDRHLDAYSLNAQDVLAQSVHTAFQYLVNNLQTELVQSLPLFLSEHKDYPDDDIATSGILSTLTNTMSLFRKCRVNAALTIQLFSQLFHFINMWLFNKILTDRYNNYCCHTWGVRIKHRLLKIEIWAEKQGLELAADCHLARIGQLAFILQAPKNSPDDATAISSTCFKLNSLQLRTIFEKYHLSHNELPVSPDLVNNIIKVARNSADELLRSEGCDIRLEENSELHLPFLLPEDGYSYDIIRGVPGGLAEFLVPLQQDGLCKMTIQASSSGFWTIYMKSPDRRLGGIMNLQSATDAFRSSQPEIVTIQLKKSGGGMGLSIVAARGIGQNKLGIYIKSVVKGGASDLDGRLQSGDQLLSVDGYSLQGITQEQAAELLTRTGSLVTLEVAKQGAIYHGLATLLSQPSPVSSRSVSNAMQKPSLGFQLSDRDIRNSVLKEQDRNIIPSTNRILTSKSVPSLNYMDQQDDTNKKMTKMSLSSVAIKTLPAASVNSRADFRQCLSSNSVLPAKPIASAQPYIPSHVSNNAPVLPPKPSEEQHYQNLQGTLQFSQTNPSTRPVIPCNSQLQHNNDFSSYSVHTNDLPHYRHSDSRLINDTSITSYRDNILPGRPPLPEEVIQSSFPSTNHSYGSHHGADWTLSRNKFGGSNPWEREEKEKEQARRLATARSYRDQQIAILESVPFRTLKQEEQLNALRLEREFQKRAEEISHQDEDEVEEDEEEEEENDLEKISDPKVSDQTKFISHSVHITKEARLEEARRREQMKRKELEAAQQAEQRILQEAQRRQDEEIRFRAYQQQQQFLKQAPSPPPPERSSSFNTASQLLANPEQFIIESEDLFKKPAVSPSDAALPSCTPGVIGTQEVYRDARQRCLEAKQQELNRMKPVVPEKLTFREKMKMFALESGEKVTPRDKVKISRAQREIEMNHEAVR